MSGEIGAVIYGQATIAYAVRRSSRKTLAIAVHPDGAIHVTAPKGAKADAIAQRVRKRARWIKKQQRYFLQFQPRAPERRYVSGETHLYLGRRYRLKIRQGRREDVKLQRGDLLVTVSDRRNAARVREVLDCWYFEKARNVFNERLLYCWTLLNNGNRPPRLQIRSMKSRWGSLSQAGLMTLNLALVRAPKSCIDYVIVHELCHLKHHHHGPAFYRLLSRQMPDWEARKHRLEWLG